MNAQDTIICHISEFISETNKKSALYHYVLGVVDNKTNFNFFQK